MSGHPQMLRVTPTSIRVPLACQKAGKRSKHALNVHNSSDTTACAFKLKSERRCARHTYTPPHGVLAPGAVVEITVDVDPSTAGKDRIVVMSMPTDQLQCPDVPHLMSNARVKFTKFKVSILRPDEEENPNGEEDDAEDEAAEETGESTTTTCTTTHTAIPVASFAPKEVAEHLVRTHNGQLIFATFFGSNAYNLTTSSSADIDIYGVYIAPLRDVVAVKSHLSPMSYAELLAGQQLMSSGGKEQIIDFTIREAANFCSLLVTGSPNTIEMLYMWPFQHGQPSSETFVQQDIWAELAALRDRFLTKRFAKLYLGWAINACERKRQNQILRKGICHAMRILAEVERLLDKRKGPRLVVKDGSLRDELLAIKRGERDGQLQDLTYALRVRFQDLDRRINESDLPENVSPETHTLLNQWLYNARLRNMS
ncbi:hypothetical protein Pelo_15478 [Pelomyxa schiedti]|nr:hypothetical protein Pelo_15478 [Pelomyxa schiedti]